MIYLLQAEKRKNYALATYRTDSVRDFLNMSIEVAGFALLFECLDASEAGNERKQGKTPSKVNWKFYRPPKVDLLIGSLENTRRKLRWKTKTTQVQLCQKMLEADSCRNERWISS